jgi:NodT family efflux transporter outer membrane factor (OMF) lipoprotein
MRKISRILPVVGLAFLTACTMGPDYERPSIEVPTAYKEDYGQWRHASPHDEQDRGVWWAIYKDPVLDNLEKQIDISNQNLKAAEAAYHEADAVAKETRTALFPGLTLNFTTGRQKGEMPTPTASDSLYATASWTPDVWGRIRRGVESDEAKAQASAADLASARLSMQATLATDYFDLRAQDELKRLFDKRIETQKKAVQLAQRQYDSGTGDAADVHAAQMELENVQAQTINAKVKRAQLEHAIAVLIGKPSASFSLQPDKYVDDVQDIPADVPSALLERRPDIASSERMVMAANAQIGVAQAAWFPDLTLSASSGFASMALSKLLQASNSFWAFGPTLAETVFDAGAREYREEQAKAAYDQSIASYRQTVLTAFQQVEDNLASVRILTEQRKAQEASVAHARMAEKLTLAQYTRGIDPYSSVLAAQNARLGNEQTLLMVRQSRLDASIALIQALGGGWTATSPRIAQTPHW